MVPDEEHPHTRQPDLEELLAGPPRRASVSPIARTLEIVDRTPGMVSFACGNPASEALPVEAIAAAAASAIREEVDRALQYVSPRGLFHDALIEFLIGDGISATADELLPTTGAIQGLALLAHALLEPADVVITEWPTYPVNLASFRIHGARTIGVPMDDQGMRIDLLDRLLDRLDGEPVKLIYVIPDAQNPTGITMNRARREALCAVAAAHGIPVIEDSPYRRLTFGGEPEPAVRTLGALSGARVIFVGSFAKTVAPGLRAGYVLAEPALIDSLTLLKQGEDFCSPGVSQIVIERLIRDGTLARQESILAGVHGAKRDAMLAALEEEMRGLPVHWTRPNGGLFLWLTLPEGTDADRILERAIERQVAFIPGRYFYPDEETGADGRPRVVEPPSHTLRLNFSYPPLDQIRRGIGVLAGVLRETL